MTASAEHPQGKSVWDLQKLSYTHDALIDLMIAHPEWDQGKLAAQFGYTAGWLSRIIRSDIFRERLAARKGELVDPLILQALEDRFEAMASRSLDVIMKKLDHPECSADVALKALDLGSRALGFGVSKGVTVNTGPQYVVAMPAKEASPQAWVERYAPKQVVDVTPSSGSAENG